MKPRTTIASIGIGTAMVFGAVDASALNETPLERVETIKNEVVEVRQVGNVVETSMGWKGEPGIKIKADMGEPTLAERLADKRKKEIVTEVIGDNMKIDFLLNEKPDTNVFCQPIEGAENYNWYYQPPLTPEEIAEGAERPENVVGSYAVYHKTLANHRMGGVNYETGKAWHIYRPQVWSLSSSSTKEWAELGFNERTNELCVTVPQDFLDKAEYPVRVDPTFGYTSVGASNEIIATGGNDVYANVVTTPSDSGTVEKLTIYTGEFSNDPELKPLLYLSSTGALITNGVGPEKTLNVPSAQWVDFPFTVSSEPSPVASTDHDIGFISNSRNRLYYDTGSSGDGTHDLTNSYTSPQSISSGNSTHLHSIYATYTADAGGGSPLIFDDVWFIE